jgi:PAS domain S-box-containing protein
MTTVTANIGRAEPSDAADNKHQTSLHELQHAEEVARCSGEDLADFLENAPVPIHSVDPAGMIVWANRAELELLGYRADEYIGRPIAAFHADPSVLADMMARLARGETLRDYETRLVARDGTLRHVLVSSNMLVRDGEQILSRWFSRDITDRKRAQDKRDRVIAELSRTATGGTTAFRFDLPRRAGAASTVATVDPTGRLGELGDDLHDAAGHELAREVARQSEERFRMLVESVKDYAIFMLDADGRVATWNAGAQRIKGYNAGEIIGRHFSVFYPDPDIRADKTEHELHAARRDGRFEDEGWRLRKDGSMFWANVIITALRDPGGALLGYAKVTQDLTQRRKLEKERVQRAHAQEAVRLRDEFLSLASHELKTPLTVLQLQLEALGDRVAGGDRATIAKLDRSRRACTRLAELVAALLDVSRIATGRVELNVETADVAEIVATAVDRMHESAEAAGCTLSVAADPAIGAWDRSRIDQMITNLVKNAIRYAAGTPIEVAVSGDTDAVLIEVRDHGPGLPEGQLALIFERFERAASMRHYGGLGLGLYVVRQVVEAHGGSVTASNALGGGACFTVRLPLGASGKDLGALDGTRHSRG